MDETSAVFDLIYPIRIPTPFAVGDVYSYLLKDEKVVLVDCGHKSGDAFRRLRSGLREAGVSVSDVDEIWLTHGHPDHFGQAAHLAEKSGANVYGHTKGRANYEGNSDGRLFEEFFREQGIPGKYIRLMTEQLAWLQQFQEPVRPEWIEDEQVLTSGRLSFTVRHAPGHAPGHVVFCSDQGVSFGGDVLLPHISTNALINIDPDTGKRNKSLLQYRNALEWIQELEGVILPGHGERVVRIRETANRHLDEQMQRYASIQSLLQKSERGHTLFELALSVFPDAVKNGAVFLVLSEIMGYLDWGIHDGLMETGISDRGVKYRAVK